MSGPLLAFEGASFGYGDAAVLENVDLAVGAGELVGVLGANGSGKTTLVRGATRLIDARHGRVTIGGVDVASMERRAIARAVAVVPQDRSPVFSFSVLETVLMGRTAWLRPFAFETDEDIEIAHAALDAVGLDGMVHRPLQHLSGGERQRVIVARALAQQTRLVLADEPTAHLDLRHAVEVFALLARLCRERDLGVLVVTHDLNLAAVHCDRVVLLGDRGVLADGTAADVLQADLLSRAFGTEIEVVHRPDGPPLIIPRRPDVG